MQEQLSFYKKVLLNNKFLNIIIIIFIGIIIITSGYILYNSQKNSIIISDSIITIEENEYTRKQIVNVDIPNSVITIGNNAFRKNKLTNVTIPESVSSIGENAFADNRLTVIIIGANVTLENQSFGNGFEEAYKNNEQGAGTYIRSNTRKMDWVVWYENFRYLNNNGNITITDYNGAGGDIIIPSEINGNIVIDIGIVFRDRNLTSVTIPGNIKNIAENAFRNNRLTSINIGNGVETIGNNAFDENRLTSVAIPNSVTRIGNNAFCCNQLTNITIGNRVTTIGTAAFAAGNLGTGKITNVVIPNSVTTIGYGAFMDQTIINIRIGANVTLGTDNSGNIGILGRATGFNSFYNNGRRSGTYTRANANSTNWTRR